MSNITNTETLAQLQEDWKKGWGRLYQKDAGKMSNQKALYFSAKDYIKMYRKEASQFMIDLIDHKIEVGKFKKFTLAVGKSLGLSTTEGELSQVIINKLSEVCVKVEEILSTNESLTTSQQNLEINSRDAFIKFWFEKLESEVIGYASEHGLQKAILFSCRNHSETQKIVDGLFTGMTSHTSKLMNILKNLLGTTSSKVEDIISSIYDQKKIPNGLKYTVIAVNIRKKLK